MNLPEQYQWLLKEDAPKMLISALQLYGVKEIVGSLHNKVILGWAQELGLGNVYTNDEIAWCGLAMAKVVTLSGYEAVKEPLWALNWNKFGINVKEAKINPFPCLGDILTFTRTGGGHVTEYVGEDKTHYHCLGGNQSNSFSFTRIEKSRLSQARRPIFKVRQPDNVRRIELAASGVISTNEA